MGYTWARIWHDADNRMWAEHYTSGDPGEAKRRHKDDCLFGWASGVNRPGVTALEFRAENGHPALVRPGQQRETVADRAWQLVGARVNELPDGWTPPNYR